MKRVNSTRLCTKYSGYLHYLGCNLLVDSPTNGVIDIHGAGEIGDDTSDDHEQGYTKGVMNCILNTETCVRLAQNNVTAKTMKKLQKLSTTRCETMSIMEKSAFECIGFKDKLVRVQFWPIPIVHDATKENEKKGTNHLVGEEIQECYCFEEKGVPK